MQELKLATPVKRGDRNDAVKRVQEWVGLHGRVLAIDGDFGPATEAGVRMFQQASGLPGTGIVDAATWDALVAPLKRAVADIPTAGLTVGALTAAWARQQLASDAREIGGDNRGPWVRLYMSGRDGADQLWCAGFASFCLGRAATALGAALPFETSVSCDVIAAAAKKRNLLLGDPVGAERLKITPGSFFLLRKAAGDWTHTGVVVSADADVVHTIEGNTNDDGSRNGYEVCQRTRGFKSLDFALVA